MNDCVENDRSSSTIKQTYEKLSSTVCTKRSKKKKMEQKNVWTT